MPKRDGNNIKQVRNALVQGAITPDASQQFGVQGQQLFRSYKDQTALLRLQRAQLAQQMKHQRADIRQQGRFDMQSAGGAANERGVLGSSSDATARMQVKAGVTSQVIQARDAKRQGMNANLSQLLGVRTDYRSGLMQLAAQKHAMKAMGVASDTAQGIYDSLFTDDVNEGKPGKNRNNPDNGTPNNPNDDTGLYGTDNSRLRDFSREEIAGLSTKQQGKFIDRTTDVLKAKQEAIKAKYLQNHPGADVRIQQNGSRYQLQKLGVDAGAYEQWDKIRNLKKLQQLNRKRSYAKAQFGQTVRG